MRYALVVLALLFLSPLSAQAALTDNLVSYWKLDEASGNAADSVGSNTLTNNNTVPFSAGKINNGADFEDADAESFSITDAAQSGLDFSDEFTVAFWYKPESVPVASIVFLNKWLASGNQRSYEALVSPAVDTGNIRFTVTWSTTGAGGGSTNQVAIESGTHFDADTWHHLAVTKSGTSVTAYVNAVGASGSGSNGTIFNGSADIYVSSAGGAGNFIDGMADEYGLWSRALSSAEIEELYNAGSGCSYPFSCAVEEPLIKVPDLIFFN